MSLLRVELFFDDEADNWHYRVPGSLRYLSPTEFEASHRNEIHKVA